MTDEAADEVSGDEGPGEEGPEAHAGPDPGVGGPDEVDLRIVIEAGEGPMVCRLWGEIDALNAPRLRAVLLEHAEDGRDGVIDLAGLRFIDSSGLSVLVGALKRYHSAGQSLSLRAPTPSLRRVLDMTGLARAFVIEEDR
ncbi:MAG: STAS domain-containing protein [Acidimicrobiales bacterium]